VSGILGTGTHRIFVLVDFHSFTAVYANPLDSNSMIFAVDFLIMEANIGNKNITVYAHTQSPTRDKGYTIKSK